MEILNKVSRKTLATILFLAVFAVCAVVAYFTNPPKIAQEKELNLPEELISGTGSEIPIEGAYWFGSDKPKITIVEFGAFDCPICKNAYPKIRQIGSKYQDEVKIVFRDFPVHSDSLVLAMAGRCAGEQGLFWPMYDKLFAFQGSFATTSLPAMASQIGADTKRFSDCLSKNKYLTNIQADFLAGDALGVKGTPTFFINGYKVAGDIPLETWEEIIQKILNYTK